MVVAVKALFISLLLLLLPAQVSAEATSAGAATSAAATADGMSSEAIMQQFASDEEISEQRRIEAKRKHEILFMMGVGLLVLLLTTGSFGIAMVAFGKNVFVPHMILAGLTMTLGIVHAVTATVWFWPY